MRHLLFLGLALFLITSAPLSAQSDNDHVFVVNYRKVYKGKEAEYGRFVREFSVPYYAELVKQTPMVSHRSLIQISGSGEYEYVFIAEYESWDAVDDPVAPEVLDSVCQAAFGKTCNEHRDTFEPLEDLRILVKREVFASAGGS